MKSNIENFADEYSEFSNTLLLGVTNETEPSKDGVVFLNSIDDTLNIQFANLTDKSSEYILKVFLDYVEIKFYYENLLCDNYMFQLEAGESVVLPVHLESLHNFDTSRMLTVGVFSAPQKHAKQLDLMSNSYGMVLTYELVPQRLSRKMQQSIVYEDATAYLSLDYQGVMLNTDFSPLDNTQVFFPPIDIAASPGEKIPLAYRVGNYDKDGGIILSVLVNWSQQTLGSSKFLYVKNTPGYIGYGEIEITAPSEPGEYEVVAFVVDQPFAPKNAETFHIHDTAYRFTLTVK